MSPKQFSEILFQIFSEEGYKVNGFTFQSESPMVANTYSNEHETSIKFGSNYPRVSIKRLITLYAYVEEIVLGKNGGSIKLKNFPDINFSYEKSLLSFFEANFKAHDDLYNEIEVIYSDDPTKKKIAYQCLQYGNEWATIVSQSGGFCGINGQSKKELKSQCLQFVIDNVRKDFEQEKKYGSVILTYLLVFIVIPAVAKFIITRLLEKYF
jgi:cellulose synthase/poly-beta-1,6-N-acetylglucosamine synthase-like glycosyltransferase